MAMVTIDLKTAERLYDLFHNVEAADAHYKRCQSDQFRVHVQSVYQNAGVHDAFEALSGRIKEAKAGETSKTATATRIAQNGHRGILGDG